MHHDVDGNCLFADLAYVRGLRPRAYPHWHSLERCRHIGVLMYQSGRAIWLARYLRRNKTYCQRRLASVVGTESDGVNYERAHALAKRWFAAPEVVSDASPSSALGPTLDLSFCPFGSDYTVGHALADYIARLRYVATPGGLHNAVNSINYYLVPTLSNVLVADFTGKHLEDLALVVLSTPPKKGTTLPQPSVPISSLSQEQLRLRKARLNSLITIMRVAFRLAWENGRVETERPWRCLRTFPTVKKPRTIFLSRDDCRRLLEACDPPLRDLALGALYTGCRVGELGSLRVGDVASSGFGIHVAPFKRGPARFVFLPDEGMAFFLSLCEGRGGHEHVFLSARGYPWVRQHRHFFKKAVDKAGLPKEFVFHGLRHTYASQLVRAGVSLDLIARQLGHSGTRTVSDTYGHLAEQYREEQIRRHFSPLSEQYAALAREQRDKLELTWRAVQPEDWRRYPAMPENSERPRRLYVRGNVELNRLFDRYH